MPVPYYYLDLNAENACVYHSDGGTLAEAVLTEGDGEHGRSVWQLTEHKAQVILDRTHFEGLHACRQTTTVVNQSQAPLTVDSLSSLFVPDIGMQGERRWYDHRFILHHAYACWQGEAQWHHDPIEDLGLYATYNHNHQASVRFSSVGSWTTAQQYPMIMLEDTEKGETWYFEIESGSGWYIEVNARGYQDNSGLCVLLSATHEKNDGWYVTLAPGESVKTVPAVYGCVQGGFEEAVAELNAYKRRTFLTTFPGGVVPVCFNDYMNCLWAQPSRARLEPLIKAAEEVGAEIFCIDAGWFGVQNGWFIHNGDWEPYDELFGEGGLSGIIKDIEKAGMRPGVWLEIETVDIRSDFAKAHPDCLLTRHGHPIGQPQCFMDFRRGEVREHLMAVFDRLYDMGVRYIKNDYNHSTGLAIDAPAGASGAAALLLHTEAFTDFVDEVIRRHPGLMIENCGSGAMRCGHGTLSHFHIQSTSDQEYYDRYPSIVQGMLACMPPERAGIWSYPYPLDFHLRTEQAEIYPLTHPEIQKRAESGWETAFNMVNAMMGCIYLSGRICYADERNKALISTAIRLYKQQRKDLMSAHPIYPTGTTLIQQDGWTSLGLLNEEADKLLLATWRIRDNTPSCTFDLTRYLPVGAHVTEAYPDLYGFRYELSRGQLTVTLPEEESNAAAWFVISF